MKSFYLILPAIFIISGGHAQPLGPKPFKLVGEVSTPSKTMSKVLLTYVTGGARRTDTSALNSGKYSFSGLVEEPVIGNLRVVYQPDSSGTLPATNYKRDVAQVFLQPGTISVRNIDSFSNVMVKGSKAHDAFLQLKAQVKTLEKRNDDLSSKYSELSKAKDTAGMKALVPAFDAIDEEINSVYAAYVKANPKSPVALYAVNQVAGWDVIPEKVEPLLQLLPAQTRDLPSAKLLNEKIVVARKTGVGRPAMEFSQKDTAGNMVSLSSFRGKYLLLDFWASWCGPCRAENPNVVNMFNQYQGKGFTVLGVSLDQPNGREKWLKAIHDDKLTWTHVSDLQFWNNAVAVQYGIQAIPQNLLIDPQGKIVGKNLRGEDLQKKLAEIFANN
ncbi:MAG TPA: TlpA disulfide reductase family protein [Flavitalea sp.]|nr:TlpA disulfide reductase family protein [Flavitalea sp.]